MLKVQRQEAAKKQAETLEQVISNVKAESMFNSFGMNAGGSQEDMEKLPDLSSRVRFNVPKRLVGFRLWRNSRTGLKRNF